MGCLVKSIIFDLDGTLIDSSRGVQESIEHAVKKNLPDLPMLDFTPFIGPPIKEILANALGHVEEAQLIKIAAEFRDVFDSELCLKCEIYPGVPEALHELKSHGIAIYLATNKPRKATQKVLSHLGLDQYFRLIKAPDLGTAQCTPKHLMVRDLIEYELLNPKETMMVGDTMEDWEAARASKIGFAACVYGYGIKEETVNSDCLILKKIGDLTAYILKLL
jgi:phosphoglycolate phosphatase